MGYSGLALPCFKKPYCWVMVRHPDLGPLELPPRVPWPDEADCRLDASKPFPLDTLLAGIRMLRQDVEAEHSPYWDQLEESLQQRCALNRMFLSNTSEEEPETTSTDSFIPDWRAGQ